jgi:hypothetical protein
MKKIFLLTFVLGLCFNLFATTPETILAKKEIVEKQLQDLDQIEKVILEEGLTYQELAVKYPELVAQVKVASENEEGLFDKDADAPLGVPGVFWGFFLGLLGVAIVYFAMDEGSSRKDQVKNAFIGCLLWVALWSMYWFVL